MDSSEKFLTIINDRDKQYAERFDAIAKTQEKAAETLDKLCNHIIVYEEDKKHDAEFKKETREFIKESAPVINKAKEWQDMRGKILLTLLSFIMLGILGAFFNFK